MFNANLKSASGDQYFVSVSFAKARVGFLKIIAQVLNVYDVKNSRYYSEYSISKLEKQKLSSENGGLNLSLKKGSLKDIPPKGYQADLKFDDIGFDGEFLNNSSAILANGNGVIQMGNGGKANYFMIPRMSVKATLIFGEKKIPVTGSAWFDRQWGNWKDQDEGFSGWDWFDIQLNDGRNIAIISFKELKTGKKITPFCVVNSKTGTKFYKDFTVKPSASTWISPKSKATYPTSWELTIPKENINLKINAKKKEQEIFMKFLWIKRNMWDGLCSVSGKISEQSVSGSAFVKLSGY